MEYQTDSQFEAAYLISQGYRCLGTVPGYWVRFRFAAEAEKAAQTWQWEHPTVDAHAFADATKTTRRLIHETPKTEDRTRNEHRTAISQR